MSENPYQSPSSPEESPATKPIDTRAIVRYRRLIMVSVATLVPYYLLLLIMGEPSFSEWGRAARAVFIVFTLSAGLATIALLAAALSTGLLATKLHGPNAGILLGLAAFYPVVGFLPMAWVLYRSRSVLVSAADTSPDE